MTKTTTTTSEQEIAELEAEIRDHNHRYWVGNNPTISDTDYDLLVRRLTELAPNSALLADLGGERVSNGVRHVRPMLSLDKAYDDDTVAKWAETFDGDVIALPKFDGIACTLRYGRDGTLRVAATRGDGEVGEDITVNARGIKDIVLALGAQPAEIEIRGEVYMRLDVFEAYKSQGMSNPRNLAAGAIKQKDAAKSAAYNLSFAAYELFGTAAPTLESKLAQLAAWSFPPVDYLRVPKAEAAAAYSKFASMRASLPYEIDGVVLVANDVSEQNRLGATGHHPRYAVAYKFQGDSSTSTLKDVIWSVARSGAVTPVAIVEPVVLSGASVERASLHNVGLMEKMGLSIGAQVLMTRRGGVIPNVERVVEPGHTPVVLPTQCPACGSRLRREADFFFCTTPRQCTAVRVAELAHYAATTGMLGFGDVVLLQAYEAGVLREPADFYRLNSERLEALPRVGKKLATKLLAETERARDLDLEVFLRALGVSDLAKQTAALLARRAGSLDGVLALTVEDMAQMHGVGDAIARNVVEGLAESRAVIDALRPHVRLRAPATSGGPLLGKAFVFTGKLTTMGRSDAEKLVKDAGGEVRGAVSKDVHFVVIGEERAGGVSSKQLAAEKLIAKGQPLRVLSETEFRALFDK